MTLDKLLEQLHTLQLITAGALPVTVTLSDGQIDGTGPNVLDVVTTMPTWSDEEPPRLIGVTLVCVG